MAGLLRFVQLVTYFASIRTRFFPTPTSRSAPRVESVFSHRASSSPSSCTHTSSSTHTHIHKRTHVQSSDEGVFRGVFPAGDEDESTVLAIFGKFDNFSICASFVSYLVILLLSWEK